MVVDQSYIELKRKEDELLASVDPKEVALDAADSAEDVENIQDGVVTKEQKYEDVLTALPVNKNNILYPEFWRYYKPPWIPIFYDINDPFNDIVKIIYGPRGGGKTISAVSFGIIDGQMRGIPCVSNVAFSWIAKDIKGRLFKIESIPFDQELFARGDLSLKYKRLFIDEGNYLTDRLRSTSNKNLAMTDILQQARKFRMCVDFCTINYMWLDPRITGNLCDVLIESTDLYYKPYGKKNKLKKGWRLCWDLMDQSGKITGRQFTHLGNTTFNARAMWYTYNTENFVDPREARKKLQAEQRVIIDEFGNQVSEASWLAKIRANVFQLAKTKPIWKGSDLWDTLGISEQALKQKAGICLIRNMGVEKTKDGYGQSEYDLSSLIP
jgi:hypothetical protein